jgi:lipoprotein-anchoring transpeptidase ErfK/SrfK
MLQYPRNRILPVVLALLALLLSAGPASVVEAAKKKKPKTTAQRKSSRKPVKAISRASKPPKKQRAVPLKTEEIKDVERRLGELGYWIGPIDGKLDNVSRTALVAFQKVTWRKRTGVLTRPEKAAVMRATRPEPMEKGPPHIEVDLARQVLFVVDDLGVVTSILPVSTGNGKDFKAQGYWRTAVTPPGRFPILQKVRGWKKSPLGRLYYPNYIIGGIAIHGYPEVPAKPASHGCIRIPMFAAKEFSARFPSGTLVIVYVGIRPEEVLVGER